MSKPTKTFLDILPKLTIQKGGLSGIFTLFFLLNLTVVFGQNPAEEPPVLTWEKSSSMGNTNIFNLDKIKIAIALDSEGNVYVLEFGGNITKYDPNGNPLNTFELKAEIEGLVDMAINSKDEIFIADYDARKVLGFNSAGDSIRSYGTEYFKPVGLAFDAADNLYILEYNDGTGTESNPGSRLEVVDFNGNSQMFLEEELIQPYRIAVGPTGKIYISQAGSTGNGKVLVFDETFQQLANLQNLQSPGSIVVDDLGFVFVIDYDGKLDFHKILEQEIGFGELSDLKNGIENNEFGIKIYDKKGDFVSDLKEKLKLPLDLAMSSCPGKLYVNNTDISGISLNFSLEIYKRTDTEAPEITCLDESDVTKELQIGDLFKMPDYSERISVEDNCDSNVTIIQEPSKGKEISETSTVKLYAEDASGNKSDTCSFEIVITTEEEPSFECNSPADLTLELDADCGFTDPDYYQFIQNPKHFKKQPHIKPEIERNENDLSVTLKVYDGENGNFVDECNFQIILLDVTPPDIFCENEQQITEKLQPGHTFTIPDYSERISVEDNCDSNVTIIQEPSEGTGISETTTVKLYAEDAAENKSDICSFEIEIQEVSAGEDFECKSEVDAFLDENGEANLELKSFYVGEIPSDATISVGKMNFSCQDLPGAVVHLEYKNTDETSNCEIRVNVKDTLKPVVKTQNISLEIPASGTLQLDPEAVDAGSFDNCGISNKKLEKTEFTCEDLGENKLRFSVQDNSGNISSNQVTITISDPNGACSQGPVEPPQTGPDLVLFPNPGTGIFKVTTAVQIHLVRVEVFDMRGRFLFLKEFETESYKTNYEIDLRSFQSGVYTVVLYSAEKSYIRRVILSRY